MVLLALWCSLVPLAATVSAAEPLPPAAEPIADERLVVQRLDGGTVTFGDVLGPDGRAVCYAFLHPNCPLAREYGPVLGRLAADFAADRIRFVGIVCECDDPTEVETYRTSFGLTCGSVAKWLRQRIANPPSSVRLRPEPLLLKPLRCADNSGLRRGFLFSAGVHGQQRGRVPREGLSLLHARTARDHPGDEQHPQRVKVGNVPLPVAVEQAPQFACPEAGRCCEAVAHRPSRAGGSMLRQGPLLSHIEQPPQVSTPVRISCRPADACSPGSSR